jgi:hypothetical protein
MISSSNPKIDTITTVPTSEGDAAPGVAPMSAVVASAAVASIADGTLALDLQPPKTALARALASVLAELGAVAAPIGLAEKNAPSGYSAPAKIADIASIHAAPDVPFALTKSKHATYITKSRANHRATRAKPKLKVLNRAATRPAYAAHKSSGSFGVNRPSRAHSPQVPIWL